MKVWEKIKELSLRSLMLNTREDVRIWMYGHKIPPCEMNENYNILQAELLDSICLEVEADCYKCLDRYLDSNIQG